MGITYKIYYAAVSHRENYNVEPDSTMQRETVFVNLANFVDPTAHLTTRTLVVAL